MKRLTSLPVMVAMIFVGMLMHPHADQPSEYGGALAPSIAVAGESTVTIDFESIPGLGRPRDGMAINTQFTETFGVTFALEGGGSPVLAEVGEPLTALIGPTGSDRIRDDQPSIGSFFLTDDGVHGSADPPPLVVTYDPPTAEASGVILDIDDEERFTIEARNRDGEIIETRVIEDGDPSTGDGIVTRWVFDRPDADIFSLRFMGVKRDGNFGLGFDNFSARTADPGPQEPAFLPAYVVAEISSRTDVNQRSATVITVRNSRDLQTVNSEPGPCLVRILWQRPSALDGGTECTIGPFSVPSGDTVQFCSRRLRSSSGIAECDAVCRNNNPEGSRELAGSSSTVGVAIVEVDATIPACLTSLVISPQILYTRGSSDRTVLATSTPKVVRGGGTNGPTGNTGD